MSDTEKRPKRGFRRLLVVGLIVLAAILLHNLSSPNRYTIVGSTLIDRVTGKTWQSVGAAGLAEWRVKPHKVGKVAVEDGP